MRLLVHQFASRHQRPQNVIVDGLVSAGAVRPSVRSSVVTSQLVRTDRPTVHWPAGRLAARGKGERENSDPLLCRKFFQQSRLVSALFYFTKCAAISILSPSSSISSPLIQPFLLFQSVFNYACTDPILIIFKSINRSMIMRLTIRNHTEIMHRYTCSRLLQSISRQNNSNCHNL